MHVGDISAPLPPHPRCPPAPVPQTGWLWGGGGSFPFRSEQPGPGLMLPGRVGSGRVGAGLVCGGPGAYNR